MKFITKKESALKVLGRIAASWGLLLIMVVAPLCWGLLPRGYAILNENEQIKANPFFTVFMRMATSFMLTGLFVLLFWLWFGVIRGKSKGGFRNLWGEIWGRVKSHIVWLVLLSACYFGARAFEMKYILTFTVGEDPKPDATEECVKAVVEKRQEFAMKYGEQQKINPYLKGGYVKVKDLDGNVYDTIPVVKPVKNIDPPDPAAKVQKPDPNQNSVESRTTKALKDYGYFMGLMLALVLAIKNGSVYGFLARLVARKSPALSENLSELCNGRMTFVGKIFWGATLFLTVASGMLYIAAKEPLYVWPYVASMSGIACLVAVFTSFGTDFKRLANINPGAPSDEKDEKKEMNFNGCPPWVPPVVACLVVNLSQAFGTALLALVFWLCGHPRGTEMWPLMSQYWSNMNNAIALFVIIGFIGSVIAPVVQLLGVHLHDLRLKKIGMKDYGITGGNWLMICGGFEPLFVVILGVIWPVQGDKLISLCLMLVAVATVAVIALLKIAEVWSEKNSVVRNAIFTKVRGSTQDNHASRTDEELRERAVQLSYLKFYDKRRELSAYATSMTKPMPLDECKLLLDQEIPTAYLSFLVNGQHYFTQDDPFTNTVLGAHELYLKRRFSDVEVISLKRFLVNGGRISTEDWEAKVRPAARKLATENGIIGKDAMPYVFISTDKDNAMACANEWSGLLQEIGRAVQSGELDAYVNGMIVQFEDKS